MSDIFSKRELRKLAFLKERLIGSLYAHNITDEYANLITWGDKEEKIQSFLKKETI